MFSVTLSNDEMGGAQRMHLNVYVMICAAAMDVAIECLQSMDVAIYGCRKSVDRTFVTIHCTPVYYLWREIHNEFIMLIYGNVSILFWYVNSIKLKPAWPAVIQFLSVWCSPSNTRFPYNKQCGQGRQLNAPKRLCHDCAAAMRCRQSDAAIYGYAIIGCRNNVLIWLLSKKHFHWRFGAPIIWQKTATIFKNMNPYWADLSPNVKIWFVFLYFRFLWIPSAILQICVNLQIFLGVGGAPRGRRGGGVKRKVYKQAMRQQLQWIESIFQ